MSFEIQKIREGLWCLDQGVRCFLAVGEKEALLIDSGFGGGVLEACRKITDKPIQLVLTHSDRDHAGGVGEFDTVYMHGKEIEVFKEKNGYEPHIIALEEGDTLDLGGIRLEVIHLPGHTSGSIALLEPSERYLIGGDTVQSCPVYMFGYDRNMELYRESMKKLLAMDTWEVVYAAHGDLELQPTIIPELLSLAEDICQDIWPEAETAPERMPESVKIYSKGRAHFYLEK